MKELLAEEAILLLLKGNILVDSEGTSWRFLRGFFATNIEGSWQPTDINKSCLPFRYYGKQREF